VNATGDFALASGAFGVAKGLAGFHPFAFGLPFTITSPRKASSLVARSRRGANSSSSGEVSISVVVAKPERKIGCASTFSKKGMLVLRPRIRNSRSARSRREIAVSKVGADAVTLTSSES